jgi:creatinine amidohydrolase
MSFERSLEILEARVHAVPSALAQTLTSPLPNLPDTWKTLPVVATGLGSSAASAHLLVEEMGKHSPHAAVFRDSTYFYGRPRKAEKALLVVFSQGLSPNARIALAHAGNFAGILLVTSIQPENADEDRKAIIEGLEREGAVLWIHPLENEYTILPRLVGPVCSAAVALRLAAILSEHELEIPEELTRDQGGPLPLLEEIERVQYADEWIGGVDFNFTSGAQVYSHNLAAKAMEGLYLPLPPCREVFEFSHGPFQLNQKRHRGQWIFSSSAEWEADLRARLMPIFAQGAKVREIVAPYHPPWDLFFFERFLNEILLEAVSKRQLDLINWPGKGQDGPGYAIDKPANLCSA